MDSTYPPAPWTLRGDLFIALLKIPPNTVPDDIVPACARDKHRPDRTMTLAVAFVDYRPDGVLDYREFLVGATNPTMTGASTILRIWVDSAASMAGGRDLWYIPKELADFDMSIDRGFTGTVMMGGQKAANYTFNPTWSIPGRWPLPNTILQEHDGAVRRTTSRYRGVRFQMGKGTLDIDENGPVAFLRHGRVIRHVAMRDFTATFGIRSVFI